MAWFAWQSALFIILAFLLGGLVGYWYWRIQYRKVAFTESEAVTVISRRHDKAVAEKDAEIGRLQSLLAGGAGAAVVAGSVDAADGDSDTDASDGADTDASDGADTDASVDASDDTSVDTSDDTSTGTGTSEVTAEADAVVDGSGDGEGDDAAPATDGTTAGTGTTVDADADGVVAPSDVDADATDTDATDTAPVTVVELPQESDLPEETVVDVTDDAVAGAEHDAVASAVAQLPTQSTGEGDVIDLSAAEADGTSAEADEPQPEPVADLTAAGTADADGSADGAAPGVAAGLVSAGAAAGDGNDDEAADDSAEDDLERIEGIGPRIASALRSAGIRSFRRLADADVPTLQAALEAAGLRFAPSLPTWSRQARFLADGDEVGFIKLTESLVAGREPGRSR